MLKVAADSKDVHFEHATGYKTAPNLRTYDSRTYEGAYLAGVVAGAMTKTNKLGVVGSIPIPEVIRNIDSFTLGAQSVNPKVETRVVWVNKWFDPPKEGEAAQSMIDQGVDVLMQNTDSSAVLQTAEKAGKFAFGWDSDMSKSGPKAHLASAIINWAPYYKKAIGDVLDGTVGDGAIVVGRQRGGDRPRVALGQRARRRPGSASRRSRRASRTARSSSGRAPSPTPSGKEVLKAGESRRRQVPPRHQLLREGRAGEAAVVGARRARQGRPTPVRLRARAESRAPFPEVARKPHRFEVVGVDRAAGQRAPAHRP